MDIRNLSAEEIELVKAVRTLRSAEMAPHEDKPELLEHGFVTKRRAAQLLGVSLKDLEGLCDPEVPGRWGRRLPVLAKPEKLAGRIPLSEVRHEADRQRALRLEKLAQTVVDMVTKNQPKHWHAGPSWMELDDSCLAGRSLEYVAKELGVSVRHARSLVDVDGPLFAWRTARGGSIVTDEELEAYKRALKQDDLGTGAATSSRALEEVAEAAAA